jgi:hypothetical protein
MHFAGRFFLFSLADRGSGDRVFPRVCDLFFRGTVSAVEFGAVSSTTVARNASNIVRAGTCWLSAPNAPFRLKVEAGFGVAVFGWGQENLRPRMHFTMM